MSRQWPRADQTIDGATMRISDSVENSCWSLLVAEDDKQWEPWVGNGTMMEWLGA